MGELEERRKQGTLQIFRDREVSHVCRHHIPSGDDDHARDRADHAPRYMSYLLLIVTMLLFVLVSISYQSESRDSEVYRLIPIHMDTRFDQESKDTWKSRFIAQANWSVLCPKTRLPKDGIHAIAVAL